MLSLRPATPYRLSRWGWLPWAVSPPSVCCKSAVNPNHNPTLNVGLAKPPQMPRSDRRAFTTRNALRGVGDAAPSKAAYKNCSLAAWFVGDGVLDVPCGLMQPHNCKEGSRPLPTKLIAPRPPLTHLSAGAPLKGSLYTAAPILLCHSTVWHPTHTEKPARHPGCLELVAKFYKQLYIT